MKVCTDSCILGAYTPASDAQKVLDIGTGTGLLALMLAQRSAALIDAVEIDAAAASQAQENIEASPWAGRIRVHHISLQQFESQNANLYDLIICNPPFYAASHQSVSKARNVAMHSQELSLTEIAAFCNKFLNPAGELFILLPPAESSYFKSIAQAANLYLKSVLKISTSVGGKHIRTVQGFSRGPVTVIKEEELYIRNPDNSYTAAFRELLREYYLIF